MEEELTQRQIERIVDGLVVEVVVLVITVSLSLSDRFLGFFFFLSFTQEILIFFKFVCCTRLFLVENCHSPLKSRQPGIGTDAPPPAYRHIRRRTRSTWKARLRKPIYTRRRKYVYPDVCPGMYLQSGVQTEKARERQMEMYIHCVLGYVWIGVSQNKPQHVHTWMDTQKHLPSLSDKQEVAKDKRRGKRGRERDCGHSGRSSTSAGLFLLKSFLE